MLVKIYLKNIVCIILTWIKSRRLRWAGYVARMGGEGRRAFIILTGEPTWKETFRKA